MRQIDIYEPALCCSSGVCGTDVDQALVDFNAALTALEKEGITVTRHNLASALLILRRASQFAHMSRWRVQTAYQLLWSMALSLLLVLTRKLISSVNSPGYPWRKRPLCPSLSLAAVAKVGAANVPS